MAIMEWFKVNGYNFIYGSLRIDTAVQRLVYIELLALASISRVRRTVCLSEGVPYPRVMLAGLIGISDKDLDDAITHHSQPEIDRLKINEWGGIEIIHWDKYQSESYDRVRKYREKKRKDRQPVTGTVTESVTPCNGREENRREEKRKEVRAAPFNPPSISELTAYSKSIEFNLDVQQFIDFYQAKGWMIGKNRMKDWQAAVRTWRKRDEPIKPGPKPVHLCACGCGKPALNCAANKWFASAECQKKILGW